MSSESLLQVRGLDVDFTTGGGVTHAVKGASFDIARG